MITIIRTTQIKVVIKLRREETNKFISTELISNKLESTMDIIIYD
jgi:hypothetical protein